MKTYVLSKMPARGDIKSVGGKSYEWNGRRWVPARAQAQSDNSGKPSRSDYGSGRSGGKAYAEAVKDYRNGEKPAATAEPPESTVPTGRDETRTSPTGVVQTGTQTSPRQMTMEDANKILNRGGLEGKGYTVQNPFGSNQLPATSANPYFSDKNEYDLSQELPEDMYVQEDGLNLTKNVYDAGSGVEYGQNLVQMPASGKIEYEQTAGAPLTVSSGTFGVTSANESAQEPEINKIPPRPTGARQAEKWDQRYGRMTQPVEREMSDLEKNYKPDLERRRAFLDGDLNSMEALRAIEGQKGIVVTGNTYNIVNPNAGQEGENDFIKIDKAQRDTIMRGGEGAQNLLNSYTSAIKADEQKLTDTAPESYTSAAQTPTSPIDRTAQVDPAQITEAPELTQQVDVRFTDKDKSGRYNRFI